MHSLRWDDLQYVLAVAEEGSLAGAARRLGVNHATVLRRIAAFEERHQMTLFDRQANGYQLVPENQSILEAIRAISHSVEGVARTMAGTGAALEGSLRLTSTDSLSRTVLPRHIMNFRTLHPRMLVELHVTNSRLNFARLDADITVRPAEQLPADLAGERVCDLTFHIYGSVDYFANNHSTNPADHRWLGTPSTIKDTPIGRWEEKFVPVERVMFRCDSFVSLCQLAESGFGLTMAPSCLGESSPRLVRAPMFPEVLRTNLWVAAHPDMLRSERIRQSVNFFHNALLQDVDLLQVE